MKRKRQPKKNRKGAVRVDVAEVLKQRSPVARLLADREFQQRKVRVKTKYTRKEKHR